MRDCQDVLGNATVQLRASTEGKDYLEVAKADRYERMEVTDPREFLSSHGGLRGATSSSRPSNNFASEARHQDDGHEDESSPGALGGLNASRKTVAIGGRESITAQDAKRRQQRDSMRALGLQVNRSPGGRLTLVMSSESINMGLSGVSATGGGSASEVNRKTLATQDSSLNQTALSAASGTSPSRRSGTATGSGGGSLGPSGGQQEEESAGAGPEKGRRSPSRATQATQKIRRMSSAVMHMKAEVSENGGTEVKAAAKKPTYTSPILAARNLALDRRDGFE